MDHVGNSRNNGQLSNVLKKAKNLKVPKEIIERAIKKAEVAKAGGTVIYEGLVRRSLVEEERLPQAKCFDSAKVRSFCARWSHNAALS